MRGIAGALSAAYVESMEKLEEQIAHLTRTVEELSDVIARQDTELVLLKRRVQMLLEREADRESAGSGGVVLGDARPPHY
jgi:SlyX protein